MTKGAWWRNTSKKNIETSGREKMPRNSVRKIGGKSVATLDENAEIFAKMIL